MNLITRFFTILLSILLMNSCWAYPQSVYQFLFPEGFYGGVGLGWAMTKFSQNYIDRDTSNELDVKARENNFKGTLFLGYRFRFQDVCYLGAELGYGFPQANYTVAFNRPRTGQAYTNQLGLRDIFYADFTLTPDIFMWKKMMVYGRVGLASSRLSADQSLTNVGKTFASENHAGIRLGASAEYAVSKHFTIGADYIYTVYNRLYNKDLPGTRIVSSMKPEQNFVDLRLVYWPFA